MGYLLAVLAALVVAPGLAAGEESSGDGQKEVLYLLSILPYYNPDPSLNPSWNLGQDIQPAMELAKDQINNSTALLQNYSLQLVHVEGGCDRLSLTTEQFTIEAFNSSRSNELMGIIGPGCSVSAIGLGRTINLRPSFNIVMLHGGGSPRLTNRESFPHAVGTLGSTENFALGFLHLLEEAEWQRVALLYDDQRLYYQNTLSKLLEMVPLNMYNNETVRYLSPASDTFIPLTDIRAERLRVIFVLCPLELSRQIVCLSYNLTMIYEDFQWVFMDKVFDDMVEPIEFDYDRVHYNCSREDMTTALQMSILMSYRHTPSPNTTLISNTTFEEYKDHYAMYRDRYNAAAPRVRNSTYTEWANYLYDAVWAWALVLHNISSEDGKIEPCYSDLKQSDRIIEQFYSTSFNGMSGEISFNRSTGFVHRGVKLEQVQGDDTMTIGFVAATVTTFTEQEIVFIRHNFQENLNESIAVGVIITLVFFLLLLSALILQVLMVVYRKRPSIKASSTKLIHISYFGFYIVTAGTLISYLRILLSLESPLDKIRPHFCHLFWAWCLPFGFIAAFGPVGMRTWRVYRIFKHYLNPGPLISDPVLIGGVALLLMPVVVVAVVWSVVDPMTIDRMFKFQRGARAQVKVICTCEHYYVWLGLLLGYMLGVLLVLTTFSLLTRNIPNRSFATTGLRVLMYVETFLFLLGIPLFWLLRLITFNPVVPTSVLTATLALMCTAFIVFIFIPPLLPILSNCRQKMRKLSNISTSSYLQSPISPSSPYFKS